jgi:hypothetical protein
MLARVHRPSCPQIRIGADLQDVDLGSTTGEPEIGAATSMQTISESISLQVVLHVSHRRRCTASRIDIHA